jgi:hypothetical protein
MSNDGLFIFFRGHGAFNVFHWHPPYQHNDALLGKPNCHLLSVKELCLRDSSDDGIARHDRTSSGFNAVEA